MCTAARPFHGEAAEGKFYRADITPSRQYQTLFSQHFHEWKAYGGRDYIYLACIHVSIRFLQGQVSLCKAVCDVQLLLPVHLQAFSALTTSLHLRPMSFFTSPCLCESPSFASLHHAFHGFCFDAHVDRSSGIVSTSYYARSCIASSS